MSRQDKSNPYAIAQHLAQLIQASPTGADRMTDLVWTGTKPLPSDDDSVDLHLQQELRRASDVRRHLESEAQVARAYQAGLEFASRVRQQQRQQQSQQSQQPHRVQLLESPGEANIRTSTGNTGSAVRQNSTSSRMTGVLPVTNKHTPPVAAAFVKTTPKPSTSVPVNSYLPSVLAQPARSNGNAAITVGNVNPATTGRNRATANAFGNRSTANAVSNGNAASAFGNRSTANAVGNRSVANPFVGNGTVVNATGAGFSSMSNLAHAWTTPMNSGRHNTLPASTSASASTLNSAPASHRTTPQFEEWTTASRAKSREARSDDRPDLASIAFRSTAVTAPAVPASTVPAARAASPPTVTWREIARNLRLPKIPPGANSPLPPIYDCDIDQLAVYMKYRIAELRQRPQRTQLEDHFLTLLYDWARKAAVELPQASEYHELLRQVRRHRGSSDWITELVQNGSMQSKPAVVHRPPVPPPAPSMSPPIASPIAPPFPSAVPAVVHTTSSKGQPADFHSKAIEHAKPPALALIELLKLGKPSTSINLKTPTVTTASNAGPSSSQTTTSNIAREPSPLIESENVPRPVTPLLSPGAPELRPSPPRPKTPQLFDELVTKPGNKESAVSLPATATVNGMTPPGRMQNQAEIPPKDPRGTVNMRPLRSIPMNRMWVEIPVRRARPVSVRPRSLSPRRFKFCLPEQPYERFDKECKSKVLSRTLLKRSNLRLCGWEGCDAELGSEWQLEQHVRKVHIPCARPEKRQHTEVDAWVCSWDSCDRPFEKPDHLDQHLQAVHIQQGLICPYRTCLHRTTVFPNVHVLEIHISRSPILHKRENVVPLMDMSVELPAPLDCEVPAIIRRDAVLPVKVFRTVWPTDRIRRNTINKVQEFSFVDRESPRMRPGESPPPMDMPMPAPVLREEESAADDDLIVIKGEDERGPYALRRSHQTEKSDLVKAKTGSKPIKRETEVEVVMELVHPVITGV